MTAVSSSAAPARSGRSRRPGASTTDQGPAPIVPVPAPVTEPVLDLVDRSRTGLLTACHAEAAGERFTLAHLAALRAAAALLAARGQVGRRSPRRSVWEMLPLVAPDLTEWAGFFAGTGRRRQAIERGSLEVGTREADDLARQAETFLELVLDRLGLPVQPSLTDRMAPVIRP